MMWKIEAIFRGGEFIINSNITFIDNKNLDQDNVHNFEQGNMRSLGKLLSNFKAL